MKILTILALALFTFTVSAFQLNSQCNFSPSYGECSVTNNTQSVISCRLKIFGKTSMGYTYTGFEFATLYPGQFANIYVYANNPAIDPIVLVTGSATCNYQR